MNCGWKIIANAPVTQGSRSMRDPLTATEKCVSHREGETCAAAVGKMRLS